MRSETWNRAFLPKCSPDDHNKGWKQLYCLDRDCTRGVYKNHTTPIDSHRLHQPPHNLKTLCFLPFCIDLLICLLINLSLHEVQKACVWCATLALHSREVGRMPTHSGQREEKETRLLIWDCIHKSLWVILWDDERGAWGLLRWDRFFLYFSFFMLYLFIYYKSPWLQSANWTEASTCQWQTLS